MIYAIKWTLIGARRATMSNPFKIVPGHEVEGPILSEGERVEVVRADAYEGAVDRIGALCDLVEHHELIATADDSTRLLFLSAAHRARGQ